MRLKGKVALITGGGSGLGRESCLLFAEEGASIVVLDVLADRAEETAAAVAERGGKAVAVPADVTVEEEVNAAVGIAVSQFGGLDIMFNNAGMDVDLGRVRFEDSSTEAWRRVIDVNLVGHMLGAKHAIRPMRERGGGTIIMTSSAAGLVAMQNFSAYCASKAADIALVRSLALELGAYNIRVNAIAPMEGMSLNFWLPPEAPVVDKSWRELGARHGWAPSDSPLPLKGPRPPSLRDNAYAALYLASDESMYVSGVCIPTGTGGGVIGVSPIQPDGSADQAILTGRELGILADATTSIFDKRNFPRSKASQGRKSALLDSTRKWVNRVRPRRG